MVHAVLRCHRSEGGGEHLRPRSASCCGSPGERVGRICERVSAEAKTGLDLFANLTEVGFDEISIRKGQKYLTVVADHHTGRRLVWATFGRDSKTIEKLLDLLGEERLKQIKLVSCDDADWITRPVAERCPWANNR